MRNINDGGPAFPIADPFVVKGPLNVEAALRLQQGMTLRDYFAAKAMQGLLSEPSIQATAAEFAQRAYMVADAMLKEREA